MSGQRGCRITGWGMSLPEHVVANSKLVDRLDTSHEWIVERSGIHARRVASGPFVPSPDGRSASAAPGTTASLAVEAGRNALRSAGLDGSDVDMLILCTTTPDRIVPATSAAVADGLAVRSAAMDLNAACSGFTYGLVTAAGQISIGMKRILLIGAESLSQITNWDDRTNAFLFGDGAGAVLVEATETATSLLGWDLGVDGSLLSLLYADHGSYGADSAGMVMRGNEVFRQAVRVCVDSARLALARAGLDASAVSLFVPHQANARIIESVAGRLGIPEERVASVIDTTGNTSSASIPLALAQALGDGRVGDGAIVLFAGFGAGMTWASAVWRWTDTCPSPPTTGG